MSAIVAARPRVASPLPAQLQPFAAAFNITPISARALFPIVAAKVDYIISARSSSLGVPSLPALESVDFGAILTRPHISV